MRKGSEKKQKTKNNGLRISHFALLFVVFTQHHGDERVKPALTLANTTQVYLGVKPGKQADHAVNLRN